jgi:tripartite-type tricarboxylate transporter receptor subunit TctC
MTQWYGLMAPASLPQAHVDKLAAETQKAMKATGALERLHADAAEAVGGTPQQFAQFIALEQKRWKQVVERAKIKAE